MHNDDIGITISEARVSEIIDRVDRCVDSLRCVWLALRAEREMLDDENMVKVRAVLDDAIKNIEEPDLWLRGRAA